MTNADRYRERQYAAMREGGRPPDDERWAKLVAEAVAAERTVRPLLSFTNAEPPLAASRLVARQVRMMPDSLVIRSREVLGIEIELCEAMAAAIDLREDSLASHAVFAKIYRVDRVLSDDDLGQLELDVRGARMSADCQLDYDDLRRVAAAVAELRGLRVALRGAL